MDPKSDIVERLREMPSSLNDALRTMDEAGDEIERLRLDVTRWKMAAFTALGAVQDDPKFAKMDKL